MAYIGKNPKQNTSTFTPQSADPSNPVEGMEFHSDGTSRAEGKWVYQDSVWIQVGSGAGSLDIFHQDKLDAAVTGDFSTGNNATFLGGGSVAGTLAIESSAQISGRQSLKFTQAAGSLNDYVSSALFAIDPKQANSDCKVSCYFTYDGDAADIEFVVYDQTGTAVITDSLDSFTSETNATRFETTFFVPSTSTQLKWGFQVAVANSGKILVIDDVEFSTNPFVSKNLIDIEEYRTSAMAGYGSTATLIPYWKATPDRNTLNSSGVVANDSTNGWSFTASKRTKLDISVSSVATGFYGLSLNSSTLTTSILSHSEEEKIHVGYEGVVSGAVTMSANVMLDAGDVVRVHAHTASTIGTDSADTLTFTTISETEHIVTPQKNSDAQIRLKTANGWGSTNTHIRRFTTTVEDYGSSITYADSSTLGASFTVNESGFYTIAWGDNFSSAANMGITLNSSELTTSIVSITNTSDRLALSSPAAVGVQDVVDWSGFLNAGDVIRPHGDAATGGVTAQTYFSMSRIGFKALSATPVQKVAWVKNVQSAGTQGGTFTSGSFVERTLNTVSGDSEIVTLASNKFTLGAGKYLIEASSPAVYVDSHIAKLVQDPSGSPTDAIIGSAEVSATGAAAESSSNSLISGVITITASTAFNIQHRCATTRATNGLGIGPSFGVDVIYTQVKITKLK